MGNYFGDNLLVGAAFLTPPNAFRVVGNYFAASLLCTAAVVVRWQDGATTTFAVGTQPGVLGASGVVFDLTLDTWLVFVDRASGLLRVGRERDVFSVATWLGSDFAVGGRVLYDGVAPYQLVDA